MEKCHTTAVELLRQEHLINRHTIPNGQAIGFVCQPDDCQQFTQLLVGHALGARSETVASKPSFREAWKKGNHCVIPLNAFFEPDWRSGKAIPTRIARADGQPMGIAGFGPRGNP